MASLLAGVTLIFGLAWCAAAALHRASAAERHVVWTCAFAAVLLLAPMRWRVPQHVIAPALPAIAAAVTVSAAPSSGVARGGDPFTILPYLWAVGTGILMLRLLRNAIRVRSIVRTARGRHPLLTSTRIPGPLVAGLWRPAILFPAGADTWTISRRRAVLAHEAAHIRRGDPAILLTAHIATALFWFHPLCWLAARRLRAESECACDDAALRTGLLPSVYAGHLLDLARRFDTQLAIPMATTSHLESRVKSILDPLTNRSFPARAAWLAAIALTAAVLTPLTTFTLSAQLAPGASGIAGTVVDATGARVPRARVTATNSDAGNRETTVTDMVGNYAFTNIPAGHYTIEAQSPGFAVFRLGDQVLVIGGQLRVDAHLSVGSITEQVTVAAPGAPRPPTTATAGRRPIRVGGNVHAARLIERVNPVYPPDLQAQGIQGTVLLQAVISKDGVPLSLRVQNTPANQEFANAALDAVRQWRYEPTLLNGEPIEVVTSIEVDFNLNNQEPLIDDRLRNTSPKAK